MSYLLDTNVISELRKGERANANVTAWFADLPDDEIFLSVLTIGEIRRGIESVRRRHPDSAAALDHWLALLGEAHADRILPIDRAIAEAWGRMSVPDPLPVSRRPTGCDGRGLRPDARHPQRRRCRWHRRRTARSV